MFIALSHIIVESIITVYTAAVSLFLLDPFLLIQQRLQTKRIAIQHLCFNPLRRQIQRERLRSSRPNRGHPPYTRHQFNLLTKSDNWCLELLRFTKTQIQELARAFRLQDLQLENRCQATPETCLAVLLFGLAFPNRYKSCCDVSVLFKDISFLLFYLLVLLLSFIYNICLLFSILMYFYVNYFM